MVTGGQVWSVSASAGRGDPLYSFQSPMRLLPCLLPFSLALARQCFPPVFLHSVGSVLPDAGLFCVVSENNNDVHESLPPLQSIEQWHKFAVEKGLEEGEREPTRVLRLPTGQPLRIPAAFIGKTCAGTQTIPWLQPISVSCVPQWKTFDRTACEDSQHINADKFINMQILGESNSSSPVSLSYGALPVLPEGVEGDFPLAPSLHAVTPATWRNGSCHDAIFSLELTLLHNASSLLAARVTQLDYTSIGQENRTRVAVTFTVKWLHVDDAKETVEKETQRGYLPSSPLLLSSSTRFSLPFGECIGGERRPVSFRVQATAGCSYRASTCEEAERVNGAVLSSTEGDLLSTPFGNETVTPLQRNNTNEWASTPSRCSLITSVQLDIIHAIQGSTKQPVTSIVSVIRDYYIQQVEINPNITYYVSYSVRFKDATRPPSHVFAHLPRIDLRLPKDFFYPFIAPSTALPAINALPLLVPFIFV